MTSPHLKVQNDILIIIATLEIFLNKRQIRTIALCSHIYFFPVLIFKEEP